MKDLEKKFLVNNEITSPNVRIIGSERQGVYSIKDALQIADQVKLDLVLVSGKGETPIVKLIDYKKFLFEESKKIKEQTRKQREQNKDIKEIKISLNISEHDLGVKVNKSRELLEEGHKVKFMVEMKGRYVQNSNEKAHKMLGSIAETLKVCSKVEGSVSSEGKRVFLILSPLR